MRFCLRIAVRFDHSVLFMCGNKNLHTYMQKMYIFTK